MKTVEFNEKEFEGLLENLLTFEQVFSEGMRGCIKGGSVEFSCPLSSILCSINPPQCDPRCAFSHYTRGPYSKNVEWVEFYCSAYRSRIILKIEKREARDEPLEPIVDITRQLDKLVDNDNWECNIE